ncbi:MAG: LysR family transcriptional regulator [Pseudomonadales bacterium]|uniref:Transcriptional regulator n=1 Tax=Oleiphilus messinensis TaxID=141451 RepID=A0A1Y0I9K5_9GAMM|nr:LysR family transcriptional regulator [Oleiphilus messinensis]ARU56446.1 transcriptional regulator [Oleiphilus messinensis]MCG8611440.1 LysR family transcriptional regulator [Pseudomonadales bacterium]
MKNVDLNLLIIFDAIMTENSISSAAERLSMTQPAVSNAVARMRQVWNNPLFIKEGRGIKPTQFALNLWQQINSPLTQIRDAVDPKSFDPATARRRFRVACADIMVDLVWLPMRKLIEREAPNIDLHAIPYSRLNSQTLLANAEAEMVIGVKDDLRPSDRSELLFRGEYVCAMRKDHPLASEELTLERYLEADHLLVSLSGDPSGFVDEALSLIGKKRRVAMTVNHFASVPQMLLGTDLICVIANTVVAKAALAGELHITAPPVSFPPTQVAVGWHPRDDQDPGIIWLRENITRFARQEWERCGPACCLQSNMAKLTRETRPPLQ